MNVCLITFLDLKRAMVIDKSMPQTNGTPENDCINFEAGGTPVNV